MKLKFLENGKLELHGVAQQLYGSFSEVEFVINENNRQFLMLFTRKQVRVSVTCNGLSYSEKHDTPVVYGVGSLPWESNDFEIAVGDIGGPVVKYWFPSTSPLDGVIHNATWKELDDVITRIITSKKLYTLKQHARFDNRVALKGAMKHEKN
jgi:hypothetical protein